MSINIDFSFTEKFICIQSRISAGLSFTNFDIQPIYLDIDVNNAILGQKIKEALSKSIDILDGEERSKVCQYFLSEEHLEKIQTINKQRAKDLKKIYGYKTLKDLNRDYMHVSIYLHSNQYEFSPSLTNRGGATGIGKEHNIFISLDSTDEEIGNTVRIAMSLCKSIYK